MEGKFSTRLKHAWNAFMNKNEFPRNTGSASYRRPDRHIMLPSNERTLIASVINKIAIDSAAIDIRHVQLDENKRFLYERSSGLNECLSIEANLDQTGRAFIQDVVASMLDEGVVAIIPTDTNVDLSNKDVANAIDIVSMRVGKIVEWYPKHIKAEVYNENTGLKEFVIMPKKLVCIIENPFYSIMNGDNSTVKRLSRKLNLLDAIDDQISSGKLDIVIQLPYTVKTKLKEEQAEKRRKSIEDQLTGSKYGIAYIDGTEHITQLNRPVENNLMGQIEYLTNLAFSQLGLTQSILDGTANESTMLNYYNRTIEPIVTSIADELKRKFLTKTARTQNQSIMVFRDPFKLVPVTQLAELVDKFTRNEVMSSNEFRQVIGMKPSSDPRADELRNKNLNAEGNGTPPNMPDEGVPYENEPYSEDTEYDYNY